MATTSEQIKNFTPIPSFYFDVEVDNDSVGFQEVSGLESTLEIEEIVEGGNNEYKLRLPTRISFKNLILSKGLTNKNDDFYNWIKNTLLNQKKSLTETFKDEKTRKPVKIHLMNPIDKQPIKSWEIVNAYPVRWSLSNFNATENKVAILTVELAFQYLTEIQVKN